MQPQRGAQQRLRLVVGSPSPSRTQHSLPTKVKQINPRLPTQAILSRFTPTKRTPTHRIFSQHLQITTKITVRACTTTALPFDWRLSPLFFLILNVLSVIGRCFCPHYTCNQKAPTGDLWKCLVFISFHYLFLYLFCLLLPCSCVIVCCHLTVIFLEGSILNRAAGAHWGTLKRQREQESCPNSCRVTTRRS